MYSVAFGFDKQLLTGVRFFEFCCRKKESMSAIKPLEYINETVVNAHSNLSDKKHDFRCIDCTI